VQSCNNFTKIYREIFNV